MEFKLLSAWCVASASTGYVCVCDSLGSVVGSEEAADFGWNHACDGAFIPMQRYAKQVCQITPLLRCDQVYLRIALKWFQVCLADLNVFVCVFVFATAARSELGVFAFFNFHDCHLHPHMASLHITHTLHTHTYLRVVCVCVNVFVHLITCSMLRSTRVLDMITHTFGWGGRGVNVFHATLHMSSLHGLTYC